MTTRTPIEPGTVRLRLFEGVGVALVTLFDRTGRLLADETADLAATLVGRGVRAVLLVGTTGEPWALDGADRIEGAAISGFDRPAASSTSTSRSRSVSPNRASSSAAAGCPARSACPAPGVAGTSLRRAAPSQGGRLGGEWLRPEPVRGRLCLRAPRARALALGGPAARPRRPSRGGR